MSLTIGEVVSQARNLIKGVRQDAFLTDRFLFSLITKHAKWLLRREDRDNKLTSFSGVFVPMNFVELIEVDRIEANCTGLVTGLKFMRTKDKLPKIFEGYLGPLIRVAGSIDSGNTEAQRLTGGSDYQKIRKSKNARFNKTVYYWFLNDYLYFPNITWEAVRLEVMPEMSIAKYNCPIECEDPCQTRQQQKFYVPEYLIAELMSNVLKELGFMIQVPPDLVHDNQNPTK